MSTDPGPPPASFPEPLRPEFGSTASDEHCPSSPASLQDADQQAMSIDQQHCKSAARGRSSRERSSRVMVHHDIIPLRCALPARNPLASAFPFHDCRWLRCHQRLPVLPWTPGTTSPDVSAGTILYRRTSCTAVKSGPTPQKGTFIIVVRRGFKQVGSWMRGYCFPRTISEHASSRRLA